MFTISNIKNHLIGMGHGGTLNKVRNIEEMLERSASRFNLKVKILERMRTIGLSSAIYDDVYNYTPPSDFGEIIDLSPQDDRTSWDKAYRTNAGIFDAEKAIREKTLSIEGSEGSKILRINWRSRQGKVLNSMNSLTANGTWSAVTGASGVVADSITKISGSASIRFNLTSTGGGLKNNDMGEVNLTDEDEVADVFVWVYLPSTTGVTSVAALWGNDLSTNFWTAVPQTTQADGTAFKVGWNLLKFPWSTATETGTVDPATIDTFKITFTATAQNNIRVDNIIFSIGRNFDLKYYSKYLFKSASTGAWISIPTAGSDDDYVMIDNDSLPIFLMECLTDMAHQVEGSDAAFDINFAEAQLTALYPAYRSAYPTQVKKSVASYSGGPRWRGRR